MMPYRQTVCRFCSPQGNDKMTCRWRKGQTLARELTVAATNRLDDLPDCVDHKLRLDAVAWQSGRGT
jgi:hypothetical protein